MPLNARQQKFCSEYAVSLNATAAAIASGYSSKTAASLGERLLRNVEVSEKIASILAESAKRNEVTVDRTVQELSAIAFSDISEIFQGKGFDITPKDISELPERVTRSISSIRIIPGRHGRSLQITLHNKMSALEMLGKYLGMTSDFNLAIATLKTYGIHLKKEGDRWFVDEAETTG